MRVIDITARQVMATNSAPTVEIEIETNVGRVRSSAPMGTSTGRFEAMQFPAEDAVRRFSVIKRTFTSREFRDQKELDRTVKGLDDTMHFRDIGGNLAIALSYAFLKAFAKESRMDVWEYLSRLYGTTPNIPMPISNIVGGWKGQNEFQEFLFLPVHQRTFAGSVFKMNDAYRRVGELLEKEDPSFNYGKNIESAWVTSLGYDKIMPIMDRVGTDRMLKIGLDVAASQHFKGGFYHYRGGVRLNPSEQMGFVEGVVKKFPVSYVEDPFDENDWLSFSTATHRWQPRMVCGDDFYATRVNRLLSGIDKKATNTVIVKPNQVGTVSDAVEFVKEAKKHGMVTVASHRSGETDDGILSHIAIGTGCDYVKFGVSGERVTKLNEVIRIEERIARSVDDKYRKISDMSNRLMERLIE